MSAAGGAGDEQRKVVLDTNVVLDLFVFDDPRAAALKLALQAGSVRWLATSAMRTELARVLGYPNIARWSVKRGRDPGAVGAEVLARFDAGAHLVAAAPAAPLVCSDPDDRCFVDLAWAHDAELISNDHAAVDVWGRLEAVRAQGMKLPPVT